MEAKHFIINANLINIEIHVSLNQDELELYICYIQSNTKTVKTKYTSNIKRGMGMTVAVR
jgi:hypothetical protein